MRKVITRLSRDEIVEKGLEMRAKGQEAHDPWIYMYKCKSGTRKTRNIESSYYNMPDLMGDAVRRNARDNETFNVYAVIRVMKGNLKSRREDR